MNNSQELVKVEKPSLPERWDYNQSVEKIKGFIHKWKNLTVEIAQELWAARKILSLSPEEQPRSPDGTFVPTDKNWTTYCEDINSSRQVINRWLKRWFEPELPEKIEPPPLPEDKYRVIYADPPWQYGDKLTEDYGVAEHHYPTMPIEELCSLPIKDLAADNAVLFLWVTSPILEECFEVIEAWGFEYKTSIVWNKKKHNYGHYVSVRHEFLLICTRGSCLPDISELPNSVVEIERSKKHSEKPEEFRELIDKMYSKGKRIELFARKKVDGWDTWGREV